MEELSERVFTRQQDLPQGVNRLPLKEVHYNKCPAVAPLGVLNQPVQQRLNINLPACLEVAANIAPNINQVRGKLAQLYQQRVFEPINNPDHALYSGGFFKPGDKSKMDSIRRTNWQQLATSEFHFDDHRLEEMLFRYRARNAPESLSKQEVDKWNVFRKDNLFDKSSGSTLLYEDFLAKLAVLRQNNENDPQILQSVTEYGEALVTSL